MRPEDLNPAQREAVRTTEGPVLILAGAGTGKTRVITTRICHLLRRGVRPEHILAVTFTNKAANEMRERVAAMTPKGVAPKLTISTFHSLCVRILRGDIDRLGYKRNFAIYTQGDQTGLIRRIIVQKAARDEKLDPGLVIALMSRERNRGIPADSREDGLVGSVIREYQRQLRLLNAVDFDDLLVLAARLLREHPDVRQAWEERFHYLMVDEFQDTNSLQMELMRWLAGRRRNICVVGDDDQSIYGWRGAEISNILEFERYFPDPVIIKLEENYRSTGPILEIANGLIRHNRNRREKRLWSRQASGERVRLIAMPGDQEEAEFITTEIVNLQARDRLKFDDFAVLFRTNTQTRVFEEHLRRLRVPYRIIGGRSFFDRREIKDVLAWLQVLVNPSDDIHLLRVISTPPRGIGEPVIEMATAISQENSQSIWETLTGDALTPQLSSRAANAIGRFAEFVRHWQDQLAGSWRSLADMTSALLTEMEYIPWLKRGCKTPEEAAQRESGIHDLLESMRRRDVRTEPDLIDFLGSACLEDDRESAKDELERQQGVSLITMHAAKGLEFPHVYLPGLEEGVLPHKRSLEEGTRDEERRLFYVAITRAMRHLTLSYCTSRVRWGESTPCYPSSFLKELNPDYLEQTSFAEIRNRPVTVEEAKDRFSALRRMLSADPPAGSA